MTEEGDPELSGILSSLLPLSLKPLCDNYLNINKVKIVIRRKISKAKNIAGLHTINTSENRYIMRSSISMWAERWFYSSNAKDIGALYLMFALFAGLVGTAFSVLIRLELSGPGVQFIADNQLYNSIITAHAIVMIFFMVKTNANMLNVKYDTISCLPLKNTSTDKIVYDNCDIKIGNKYNNNKENKSFKPKDEEVKFLVEDPYNNRDIILKVAKKQKGVYVW